MIFFPKINFFNNYVFFFIFHPWSHPVITHSRKFSKYLLLMKNKKKFTSLKEVNHRSKNKTFQPAFAFYPAAEHVLFKKVF
ncbi:hypothetical protein CJ483_06275 [Bacillus sp. PK3_68]|nr:hypothetical protein CJ483_06275 [Bacillus sp. PK3_68]